MGEYWYSLYRFPITLPTDPLSFKSPIFDSLFIRTKIYDELDTYLDAIQQQKGKFWITSKGSGYGKSTMLNYIMRYTIINFGRLKAFPILISVGGADSEEEVCRRFFKGFIQGIFDAQENFKFKESTSPDLKKLADEFALYRDQIGELKEKMVVANMDELEHRFWKACKVIEKWRNNGIISKSIIMIDELDKLTDETNLFLSKRQNIFEHLFNDLDAVVFFSSEFSWTQQLHSGTEYTFYQGKIFENLPLIDIHYIKMLIESRLMYGPPYMKPQDNPWSEEGLNKLNEIAKGHPRLILNWTSLIMNEAAKKQVPTIGLGFVQDVIMKQTVPELRTYFSRAETYGTYLKLKQASQKLFNLLVIFYTYAPNYEILKIFDEKLSNRTRELGVEMTNEEWSDAIDTLLRFQCIIDKRNSRRLAQDIVSLFQFAEDKNIRLDALPNLLDDLRLEPRVYPYKPDFMEAIARAFDVKSDEWFNKEKLFDWFYSTQDVFTYFMYHQPRNPREAAKKVFEEKFELYIKQNETSLLKFEEEDKLLLRKKPEFVNDNIYQSLVSFNSIDIVNKYIEVFKSTKTDLVVRSSKELLREIMKKIATRCNVEFPGEFQENRGKRAARALSHPHKMMGLSMSNILISKQNSQYGCYNRFNKSKIFRKRSTFPPLMIEVLMPEMSISPTARACISSRALLSLINFSPYSLRIYFL